MEVYSCWGGCVPVSIRSKISKVADVAVVAGVIRYGVAGRVP